MALINYIGGGEGAVLTETSVSAAGTTQATATRLQNQYSDVTTVASGAGVVLSVLLAPSEEQTVFNAGANSLSIYPPSGMKINALTTNAAIQLPPSTGMIFKCVSTTRVIAILSVFDYAASSNSAAGTPQATATTLAASDNDVTTVGAGAGVILSSVAVPGDTQYVFNSGANALTVYPPSGMKINALATNAGILLATNTACVFKFVSTTRVFGVLSA